MDVLGTSVLGRAGEALGTFLPRLGGALALLLIGLLIARLIGRVLLHALQAAGLDRLAERGGVPPVLERSGLDRSLSALIARAIRIGLAIVVIFAALSLLGLQFLSPSLNQAVLALPRLFIAAALVLAGVVLAGLARDRTDRLTYQLDFPVPLGQIAQIGVLSIFGIIAAAELGISTLILVLVIGVLLAAVAGTFTLAFGLGSRDVARALSAGRYLRHDYQLGQGSRSAISAAGSAGSTARAPCSTRVKADPYGCRTISSSTRSSRSIPTTRCARPDVSCAGSGRRG